MRSFVLFFTILPAEFQLHAQAPFSIQLEEVTAAGLPGLQSFAWGQDSLARILIIAGRTDGLHRRQPFASFDAAGNNGTLYVLDTSGTLLASRDLGSDLTLDQREQLSSTNPEFIQRGNPLYFVGGYGYRTSLSDHSTFDRLIAIDVNQTVQQILNDQPIDAHVRTLTDTLFAATGGYIGLLSDTFYLVGGQYFHGRYNPMGPTHEPGFTQRYTNVIRTFSLFDDGTSLVLSNVSETRNEQDLHRRDYNLAAQIFPGDQRGFTAFSGVFQPQTDLPWLNFVDIVPESYTVRNDAQQQLNQYHIAHVVVYDEATLSNHTVFFGGLARYVPNSSGGLDDDTNVPFTSTISCISRDSANALSEHYFAEQMPGLLGSGAEFIPAAGSNYDDQEILHWTGNENYPVLAGYVYGGIESSAANIFFVNDGSQSDAGLRWFKVWLVPGNVSSWEAVAPSNADRVKVYPNPSSGKIHLEVYNPLSTRIKIKIYDAHGRTINEGEFSLNNENRVVLEGPDGIFGPLLVEVENSGRIHKQWIHHH